MHVKHILFCVIYSQYYSLKFTRDNYRLYIYLIISGIRRYDNQVLRKRALHITNYQIIINTFIDNWQIVYFSNAPHLPHTNLFGPSLVSLNTMYYLPQIPANSPLSYHRISIISIVEGVPFWQFPTCAHK